MLKGTTFSGRNIKLPKFHLRTSVCQTSQTFLINKAREFRRKSRNRGNATGIREGNVINLFEGGIIKSGRAFIFGASHTEYAKDAHKGNDS